MTDLPTFSIEFINKAKIIEDSSIYIIAKATNTDGKQCLVKINNDIGVCEAVTAQTDSSDYSYALSDLQKNSDGNFVFNLTQMYSGRIYVSMKYPLKLYIDSSNSEKIAIVDPNGFKTRDLNYYTIYDKFEFSYGDDGLYINPTAVDFFAMPIRIYAQNSTSSFKESGLTQTRSDVLKSVERSFSQFSSNESSEEWSKLFLKFDESSSVLRIMAPGKAMVNTGPGSNPTFFTDYLSDKKFGINYIDAVWDYYKCNRVKIDCGILKDDPDFKDKLHKGYIFEGYVEGDKFTFSNTDDEFTLEISKPDTQSFFAGGQGSFNFPNHTVGVIIVKELTAAFISGLLPAKDGALLNLKYFIDKKSEGKFYQKNPNLKAEGGPWYDLYSKAFSSFKEVIYTFAYGDALHEDGTLHCPNVNDIGKVSVTIGDMSGTELPDPYTDSTKYTITVNLGENKLGAFYDLKYDDEVIKPGTPATLSDVASPFEVEFNGIKESIYIKYPMVKPYNPVAEGIVIEVSKDDPSSATVNFPGPPKGQAPEELNQDESYHEDL